MSLPIRVFPVCVYDDDPAMVVAGWNGDAENAEHPLTIAAEPAACEAYLVIGSSADLADERLTAGYLDGWPDRPVIWLEGGPAFYRTIDDFMHEYSTTLDRMLWQVRGAIPRQSLLDTLQAVAHALDEASKVVDAGIDTYPHERERLRSLIERLEQGAFIVEDEESNRTETTVCTWCGEAVEVDQVAITPCGEAVHSRCRNNHLQNCASSKCERERERTCFICGRTFKYANTFSRDLGPDEVDLCSNACASKYWERRGDDEDDTNHVKHNGTIHCPKCGSEDIFVVQVSCMQHAKPHTGRWSLTSEGFVWDESGSHHDGSTEDEIAECGDCGYCCPAGALHEFGFGKQ